ncbi:MAG: hypothetical protein V2A69_03755 [Pseudomonadota bacterium]
MMDKDNILMSRNWRRSAMKTLNGAMTGKTLLRIESQRNKMLIERAKSVAGCIFDLQNNFHWADKQEIEHSGEVDGLFTVVPAFSSIQDWQKSWEEYEATTVTCEER